MNTPDLGHEASEPDPDLIRRAVQGDRSAQDQLARAVWPRVRRWAFLELADAAAADDACQEALVRMLRHLPRYDPERGAFVAWMRTITRNAARDQRRPASRPVEGGVVRMDRGVDLRRTAARALQALQRLTPRQRRAVDLCDWQGLTPTEASAHMEIAPGTVRVHLHEARKQLRTWLGGEVRDLLEETG